MSYRLIYRHQCHYRYIGFADIGHIGRYIVSVDSDMPTLACMLGGFWQAFLERLSGTDFLCSCPFQPTFCSARIIPGTWSLCRYRMSIYMVKNGSCTFQYFPVRLMTNIISNRTNMHPLYDGPFFFNKEYILLPLDIQLSMYKYLRTCDFLLQNVHLLFFNHVYYHYDDPLPKWFPKKHFQPAISKLLRTPSISRS